MNIQKTNLLVLNKNFKMKENQPAPVANPATDETAKDGMKALLFQGQQNYLNNNVGFKAGMKQKVAIYAATGLMAAAMTSCVKQDVKVDLKALQEAQAETNALLKQLLDEHKIDREIYNKMLLAINSVSADVKAGTIALEDFKTQVFAYIAYDKDIQSQILTELKRQGMNQDEANAFMMESIDQIITMLRNGQITLDEAVEALNGIKNGVDDIAAILTKFYNAWSEANAKAEADRAKLLDFAEKTYINTNTLVEQGKQYLHNDSIKIANEEEMINKLDGIQANTTAIKYLTEMLLAQGYTKMQIDQMNFYQMYQAVKEGNQINKETNAKLAKLFALIEQQGYVSEEQRAQIIELLKSIDETVGKLYQEFMNAVAKFDAFAEKALGYAESIDKTGKASLEEQKGIRAAVDSMLVQNNIKIEKLDEVINNQKEQQKITKEGMNILIAQGYTQTQIEAMGFYQANALLAEILKEEKQTGTKINEIVAYLKSGKFEKAAAEIIALLKNIDANVSAILDTVNNLYEAYLAEAKKNDAFRMTMVVNGAINNALLANNNKLLKENNTTLNNMSVDLKQTNAKLDSLIILGNEKPDQLVEVINKAINKGDEIINHIDGITVNMDATEIIKAIKEFQNTYITTEAKKIELQKENNTLLETYLPLLKKITPDNKDVLEKMEEIAGLIKENTEAVNNNTTSASEASAKELAAQQEANELLKKLIAKADAILAKMDANAEAAQKYYNNMEVKFNEIKDLIPNLENRLNTIIAKMNQIIKQGEDLKPVVDEILVEVKNLEAIAGKALTKDELDQVLNKYGDDLKVLLNTLHAETAEDLAEINNNIKKGNDIKKEILEEIKKHKDEPEILAQIKHILETKDFCHCACTSGDVNHNEGILEEIQGITG